MCLLKPFITIKCFKSDTRYCEISCIFRLIINYFLTFKRVANEKD
jgi:hypothetical protein